MIFKKTHRMLILKLKASNKLTFYLFGRLVINNINNSFVNK